MTSVLQDAAMELSAADHIWNRACSVEVRASGLGDRHLWALLRVHGCVMSGGTTFAAEVLDHSAFVAAADACTYLGLFELADIMRRVAVMYDEQEEQMNREYTDLVPRDQVLADAFERRYAASPADFDLLE